MLDNTDISSHIIEAILDKKGSKIAEIDLSSLETAPSQKLIICQGRSTAQVGAIADSVRDCLLENKGIKPINYEGYRNSQWIIIDYGEVMVHIFLHEFREFYALESLWSDAEIKFIPDEG